MPVIPQEGSGLEPSQKKDTGDSKQGQNDSGKATAKDFSSHGPQIPSDDSLPPKVSREEIEAKMKELNK